MSDVPPTREKKPVSERLEALMARVRAMERGGDLEGLLEEGLLEIRQEVYREAAEARGQAAAPPAGGDFPPCGVPPLQAPEDETHR